MVENVEIIRRNKNGKEKKVLFIWQEVESGKKLAVYAKDKEAAIRSASKLAAGAGELELLRTIWAGAGPARISESEPGIIYFDESGAMDEIQWALLAGLSRAIDNAIKSDGIDMLEKLQSTREILDHFVESLVE